MNSIRESDIARAATSLWSGDTEPLEFAGDSASHVYRFLASGRLHYLRLTSSVARTREQVEAELDFVLYLHRGGVSVALPVASVAGQFVEEIAAECHSFFACVFQQAEGERFTYDAAASHEEHFRLRGKTLGQIHAVSKDYTPSGNSRRFAWDEDKLLLEADAYLPESEKIVWREFKRLKEKLHDYPRSIQTYGLIHGDFGETNYRYQKIGQAGAARLNVFDFDDCCYHWFAYDLAVSIYPHGWRLEGSLLLDSLLEGYSEKMPSNITQADVTLFCQWRLVYMFLVYARKWGFEHLSRQQAEWFAQKRANIARGYSIK
jgi:amicoumacin kinase